MATSTTFIGVTSGKICLSVTAITCDYGDFLQPLGHQIPFVLLEAGRAI